MGKKENKKKEKKVKPKYVYFKANIYSTRYENLFNSEKYSDITLKFGETKLFAHKNILASSSKIKFKFNLILR
jgi:hypothetical protein